MEKAAEAARVACVEADHPEGCQHYAWMYLRRGEGVPKADPVKALSFLNKACGKEDWQSCYFAGAMHLTGDKYDGLARSPAEAVGLMKRGCEQGNHPNACQVLAAMYKKGDDGVKADAKLFEKYKQMTKGERRGREGGRECLAGGGSGAAAAAVVVLSLCMGGGALLMFGAKVIGI